MLSGAVRRSLLLTPPAVALAAHARPAATLPAPRPLSLSSLPRGSFAAAWSTRWASSGASSPQHGETPAASSEGKSAKSNAPIPEHESPLFEFAKRDLDVTAPLPSLRYPVVLVHGYLGYASLIRSPLSGEPLLEYFGSVRTHLGERSGGGITVITPVNPPAASIAARAKKLQLALAIEKRAQVRERKVSAGSEHTERKVVKDEHGRTPPPEDGSSHDKPAPEHDPQTGPIEFRNTGGRFDASRHRSDQVPLLQQLREAARPPFWFGGAKDSQTKAGTSIILGGQRINLEDYQGKFHLIAHSMGGLDSRYLIAQLQQLGPPYSERIASLTSVATPHRGSPVADIVLDVIDVPLSFTPDPTRLRHAPTLNKLSQWLAGLFGIDVTGISNLSTEAMRDFNARIHDAPHVQYFSYGGARRFKPWSVWYLPSKWIREYEERHDHRRDPDGFCPGGENDGLVSVGSARWGQYLGTTSLDHLEQIGLGVWNKHLPLYRQIVFRLAELEANEEKEGKGGNSEERPKPHDEAHDAKKS